MAAVATAALLAPVAAPAGPFERSAGALLPPAASNLLGTDDLGRDVLSQVLHGLRTSLLIACLVAALAGVVGVAVGLLAGYRGGWIDDILMRLSEVVQVVPRFFLAVLVVALFGPGFMGLVLVLGLTSWPVIARTVRAEVLVLRELEYVMAARAVGASHRRILLYQLLPNALPATIVVISLTASSAVLIEAGLSFIGLGDPDIVSLGLLAGNAQPFLRVAWWTAVFPGLAIIVLVVGLNLLGDSLNDALNPRGAGTRAAAPGRSH